MAARAGVRAPDGRDAGPALVLYDDAPARDWLPFTLTRPAGELVFGAMTLRARAERATGLPCIGHCAPPHLAGFDETGAPPVLAADALPRERDVLYLCSRALPAWSERPHEFGDRPALVEIDGEPCGRWVPAGGEPPSPKSLLEPGEHAPADLPVRTLEGAVLGRVWQLVTRNADRLAADLASLYPGAAPGLPDGVHAFGPEPLTVGERVEIEPGVVFDLRDGPIRLDDGARACAGTRLAGPAYVGRGTTLLGGRYEHVSIGPACKIRGELEASVVLGFTNKAHDGYMGHAYLGRWVNLGAMTTNSDLKNTYGTVRLWTPDGPVDTGETKLGCLLGDHVKTGIGLLLNTGTVVGAGSNLFGTAMPPKRVPPFSWGAAEALGAYELEKFLQVAEKVMRRRDRTLTDSQRDMLSAAWERGRSDAE